MEAIAWSPLEDDILSSISSDKSLRLWDVRGKEALIRSSKLCKEHRASRGEYLYGVVSKWELYRCWRQGSRDPSVELILEQHSFIRGYEDLGSGQGDELPF